MRRLTHVIQLERGTQKRQPRFQGVYGATYTDLLRYLRDKYGLRERDVSSIVRDIFNYIEHEVLLGVGKFRIPKFGTFEVRKSTQNTRIMRFLRRNITAMGTGFTQQADDEWIDDDDFDDSSR
jgi:hypothetical protein